MTMAGRLLASFNRAATIPTTPGCHPRLPRQVAHQIRAQQLALAPRWLVSIARRSIQVVRRSANGASSAAAVVNAHQVRLTNAAASIDPWAKHIAR